MQTKAVLSSPSPETKPPPARAHRPRRWVAAAVALAAGLLGLIVVYSSGQFDGQPAPQTPDAPTGQGDGQPAVDPPAGEPAVRPEPPAGDDPAEGPPDDEPAAESPVRFGREPQATWKVTGVPAGDVLNVRDGPGVASPVLVWLPNDAEVESTGRIARVGDQLWREIILWYEVAVPGEGVGWVNASYLTRKAPPAAIVYEAEPRANWDVTGVRPGDVLNARELPGVDHLVIATLAHDARELESTGRIAHVGGSLWREVIVPVGGSGWVNARYLTETR